MALFLANESPNLIELQLAAGKIPHLGIKQFRAPITDTHAKPHDGIPVNAKRAAWSAFLAASIYAGIAAVTYHEIAKQYPELKRQAIASEMSANAAYAELRPWIRIKDAELRGSKGDIQTLMFHWPLTGKLVPPMLQVKVPVLNVGHSVGQDTEVFSELFFGKFISDKWHDAVTQEEKRFCESIAEREPSSAVAIVFPSDPKDFYMGVGGLAQEPNSNPASALIVCVNYRGVPKTRFQTQAWFGLYEDNSVFINTAVDADASRLRLIRDESGDHAY